MMNELLRQFSDENEFGSHDFTSGEFEVYYNLSKYLKPNRILEVGVYKGHSAISMIHGAKNLLFSYTGIDAEQYLEHSNKIAIDNITKFLTLQKREKLHFDVITHNTQTDGIPEKIKGQIYDWIHIDAGHTTVEAIKDIFTFWPITCKVLTVHDYLSHKEVKDAVDLVVEKNQISFKNHFCVNSLHGFYCFFK